MLPKFLNVCAPRAPSYSEDKLKLKSFSRCEVKKVDNIKLFLH